MVARAAWAIGRPGRRVARVLTVLGALLAGTGTAARAQSHADTATAGGTWSDTTYQDAVIQLNIEDGPSAVLAALTYETKLLLPVRRYLEMVQVPVPAVALHDSLVAILEPGDVRVVFRPSAHLLRKGDLTLPYDSLDVTWWDGDLFASTALLDRLLGVRTDVNWPTLVATVGGSSRLPVVAAARRDRRHAMLAASHPVSPDILELPLRSRAADGAVASWSLTAASGGPTDQMDLDLGFGAELFGGGLELRPSIWSTAGTSQADWKWSWSRISTEPGQIPQFRLGDVVSGGRTSREFEGAMITNAPYVRSSQFDVEQFVARVPQGWEAELYESGRLLSFADASQVGEFRTPLQLGYGQNPLELVLYGPGGQTEHVTRTIRVPYNRLPEGRFEYAFAAGACRYDPCQGYLSGDARYGLSEHVTLQAGWDAFSRRDQAALWQPYLIASGALLPSLGLTGEAVANDHLLASANYEPTEDLRVTATQTWFSQAGASLSGAFGENARSEGTLFWRPPVWRGTLYVQGTGVLATGPGLRQELLRLSGSVRVQRIRYTLGVLDDALHGAQVAGHDDFMFDASADAVVEGPWRWLRGSTVQSEFGVDPRHGITALRGQIGRSLTRAVRLDASLGWLQGSGATLELAFSTSRPGPRMGLTSRSTSGTGSEELLTADGSMAVDPRTHVVEFSDASGLGRAGISGVLFRDDNNNGIRDANEPGIAGIPVQVGGWPAETDSSGRFAAWGMNADQPTQITVDTLSFGNPQLMLPAPVVEVRPEANAFGVINVPVVVGAEVGGIVLLDGQPVPGVPVVLRELDTGAEITILSYADGAFYKGSVPPGDYEVTVPDAVLQRLAATVPPLGIFVPPGAGEKRFMDLRLTLQSVKP